MKNKLLLLILLILPERMLMGQSIVEKYVEEGLSNNLSIKQQQFSLEKSKYALREAKTLFLPVISFTTDYFLSKGGRTVDFPAADLLNPVYESLNELTNSNQFRPLENQSIQLNPNNFYDIKFRTSISLLNLEIEYNKRIKTEEITLQQIEIELFKRELAKEIKIAYYQYLQSLAAVQVYETALNLAKENKRVNEVLFKNDKVNRTVVLRADNEVAKFEALWQNAKQNANSVKAFFNFLLNKNLTDSILLGDDYQTVATIIGDVFLVENREELQKLKIISSINQHSISLSNASFTPKLNSFIDVGSQGFDWQFDKKSRYYFFGVSLRWDLFSSGKNHFKVKQLELDNRIIESKTQNTSEQLKLNYTTTLNTYNSSIYTYESAVVTRKTSQKYYSDMLRMYKEGQVLFIELLDAQNQLVQSELQAYISLYDTYIKAAEVERAS
ncbi:MAG: TolC family protein, partial [Flavobacterium sp.]|nr:TolC family protein [Flavobacterium sp.]